MIINDARCTREIKSRIAMAKTAISMKQTTFISIPDFEFQESAS
jgi:hypothetical protein